MASKSKVALVLGAVLMAGAPAINALVVSAAVAQTPTVQQNIAAAVQQAVAALGSNPSPAQLAAAKVAAVQSAVAAALKAGASAAQVAAAVKAVAAAGVVSAAQAAQGVAQAAAQIAADPQAPASAKAAASATVSTLANDTAFAAAVASSGGIQVSATGDGGAPTVLTDLGSVLTALAGGSDATVVVTVPPQYDPCDNLEGDYC